jgi:hypothetical protein
LLVFVGVVSLNEVILSTKLEEIRIRRMEEIVFVINRLKSI